MKITKIESRLVQDGAAGEVASVDVAIDGQLMVCDIHVVASAEPAGFFVRWPNEDPGQSPLRHKACPLDAATRAVMDAEVLKHFYAELMPQYINAMTLTEVERGLVDGPEEA